MGRRAKSYVPKAFESVNGNKVSANLYATMLQSKAWEQLSNGARVLYLYMKMQYYGQKNIPDHTQDCFYFNTALVRKTYKLYTNMNQFRKDRQQLVDKGFIEVVENGKNTRTKNIYRFISAWQKYG